MLQFITHATTPDATIHQAEQAIAGGCRWVQVRMKGAAAAEVRRVLEHLSPLCARTSTTLIVDDHVELATLDGVHGVHLGQTDMSTAEARRILGPGKIIGLTVNNMEHARGVLGADADYLGIGPWRFTGTKQNLAALLGESGVREILTFLRDNGCRLPAVVIGGVTADDIAAIVATDPNGRTGIAVSGAIAAAADISAAARLFTSKLEHNTL